VSDANPAIDYVRLCIVSPEQIIFEGHAKWVQVPLEDGLAGIWPGHSPLIGALGRGKVEFLTEEGTQTVGVAGGILRVTSERCVVLVSERTGEATPAVTSSGDKEVLFSQMDDSLGDVLSEEQIEEIQAR